MILTDKSHRRFNPLTGEWVLISPQRTKRPWQGKIEKVKLKTGIKFDPECYLCPGNERAGGLRNPVYKNTFVFENDFSALDFNQTSSGINMHDLIISESEPGICKVVCFSPRHDLTLPEMRAADIRKVVDTWIGEFNTLGNMDEINYVQIFENKGEIMGCSNPHPHGQIWATHSVPVEPMKETLHQKAFLEKNESCLLCEYAVLETELRDRIIIENEKFIVVVPFWAVWPFETMVLSKRHIRDITVFTEKEKELFGEILKEITGIYDKVFNVSFPYSAGMHQAPTDNEEHSEWHFHYHFFPPLLRSADIKKYMVGFEMLANPQKDFTAETAAGVLKNIVQKHLRADQRIKEH